MQEQKSDKKGFFQFILSRQFFIQLGIATIAIVLLFFLLIKFLDSYTRHGKELNVPNFKGMTLMDIDSAGYFSQFDFFVIDSLYAEGAKKGSVIIQDPIPGSKVKQGRNIYFTIIASTSEKVIMPELKDLTLRQAINVLEASKLKTGKLIYQPSFDKNAVLEQMFQGDTVFPGDTLVIGSLIDLIIGSGERNFRIPVPFLIGLSREKAIYELNIASFNLGNEFYLDSIKDEHSKVYMQEPRWDENFPFYPGDSVHLWYRSDTAFDFDTYLQTFLPDSLNPDSLKMDSIFDHSNKEIF